MPPRGSAPRELLHGLSGVSIAGITAKRRFTGTLGRQGPRTVCSTSTTEDSRAPSPFRHACALRSNRGTISGSRECLSLSSSLRPFPHLQVLTYKRWLVR